MLAAMLLVAALPCLAAAGAAKAPGQDAPVSPQALLDSACELAGQGKLADAAAALEQAVAAVPNWAPPRALLGEIYQVQGREQEARQQYQAHQFLGMLEEGGTAGNLSLQIAEAAALLIYRINSERLTRGLRALLPSAPLSEVARGHSQEMRDLNYFSHFSPRRANETMVDRFKQVYGVQPRALAENLSRRGGYGYAFCLENIESSHERLMDSARHRESILWDKVTQLGVGIAVNENGDYWITETFASDCQPHK